MIDQIYGFGHGLIAAGWWTSAAWPVTWALIKIVAVVLPLMGAVAYLTLWERKASVSPRSAWAPTASARSACCSPSPTRSSC